MDRILLTLSILIIPIVTIGQQVDYDSTFNTNGQKFQAQLVHLPKSMTVLKVRKGKDIILTDTLDFTNQLTLQDFNGDDGLDILLNFMGSVDHQSLLLLDKSTNLFNRVKDFEKYQAAKKVNGSNTFYSYHRSGCADNYWTSDLFKIVDFRVIHLGQMLGEGCEEPTQIKIYRINQGKRYLIEILPYKLVTENKGSKWGFIEVYWTKNHNAYE